jgi:hypothetical protein
VALAGDHAHTQADSWRDTAAQIYLYFLAALAFALVYFFPPHFDLRLGTIVSVAIVALFLIAMERPVKTAATTVAPLTAILAASGVVFGAWMMVLAVVAVVTVQLRMRGNRSVPEKISTAALVGQAGVGVFSTYGVLGVWHAFTTLAALSPSYLHALINLFGVIAAGLVSQTINNLLAYVVYAIHSRPFVISQLLRTGIVASIYAYLLVATYSFGGIIATTIFYVVVAQIKVIQDVLGITAQLHKLERAQAQAQGLARDMIRLTDAENVEFASEVQNIAQMMGRRLGMPKKEVELLGLAAELHEMGKSHIPARIRLSTSLNNKELAQRKTYTRWGGLMVRAADALLPNQIADWIEFHGEHFDGTGYPRGLSGEDIPLASRIIMVAHDYVRFLTGYDGTHAVEKEKALTLLREGSGTLYDPRLVALLYELVS